MSHFKLFVQTIRFYFGKFKLKIKIINSILNRFLLRKSCFINQFPKKQYFSQNQTDFQNTTFLN